MVHKHREILNNRNAIFSLCEASYEAQFKPDVTSFFVGWCIYENFRSLLPRPCVGGAVASWLVRSSPDRAVWVRALAGNIVLCSWAKHFTLTVPLSTQGNGYRQTESSNFSMYIIMWQIVAWRTNHDREFCYRYDYRPNWTPLSPITITNSYQKLFTTVHHC